MAMRDYIRAFAGNDLGRIVSSNACDGELIGLHPLGFCGRVLASAYANAPGDRDKTDPREFIRLISDLATNDISFRGQAAFGARCEMQQDRAELILPLGVLQSFATSDDIKRFARLTGALPDFRNSAWISTLRNLPSKERYFRLKPGRPLGTSFVWFSSKRSLDRAITEAKKNGIAAEDIANYLRDRLGLVHRAPSNPPLYLAAFTLPGTVIEKAVHFRPTFVEAGGHKRFAARPHGRGLPRRSDWGKTIDLAKLELNGELLSCMRERVCLPIDAAMFTDDENVKFRIVGEITRSNKFTDQKFSEVLANGRSDEVLAQTLGNLP